MTNTQFNLLLAAGEARRMGMPKQLLVRQRQPLIRKVINTLQASHRPVAVVLGARAKMIEPVITDIADLIIINEDWQKGMGHSLKFGLQTLIDSNPELEQVLCSVVDQVHISSAIVNNFWLSADTHPLLAAQYDNGQIGVPALFSALHFPALLALNDRQGAKPFLQQQRQYVKPIHFPLGQLDIDTLAEWLAVE